MLSPLSLPRYLPTVQVLMMHVDTTCGTATVRLARWKLGEQENMQPKQVQGHQMLHNTYIHGIVPQEERASEAISDSHPHEQECAGNAHMRVLVCENKGLSACEDRARMPKVTDQARKRLKQARSPIMMKQRNRQRGFARHMRTCWSANT